jgi:prepilin signal peptidase PulO-like enzyme (type II secretory pathway)
MKSMIPLGPFLVAGTFIAYFFGEAIISFYLG